MREANDNFNEIDDSKVRFSLICFFIQFCEDRLPFFNEIIDQLNVHSLIPNTNNFRNSSCIQVLFILLQLGFGTCTQIGKLCHQGRKLLVYVATNLLLFGIGGQRTHVVFFCNFGGAISLLLLLILALGWASLFH